MRRWDRSTLGSGLTDTAAPRASPKGPHLGGSHLCYLEPGDEGHVSPPHVVLWGLRGTRLTASSSLPGPLAQCLLRSPCAGGGIEQESAISRPSLLLGDIASLPRPISGSRDTTSAPLYPPPSPGQTDVPQQQPEASGPGVPGPGPVTAGADVRVWAAAWASLPPSASSQVARWSQQLSLFLWEDCVAQPFPSADRTGPCPLARVCAGTRVLGWEEEQRVTSQCGWVLCPCPRCQALGIGGGSGESINRDPW